MLMEAKKDKNALEQRALKMEVHRPIELDKN